LLIRFFCIVFFLALATTDDAQWVATGAADAVHYFLIIYTFVVVV
jgi:hypothetical protein